MIKVMTKEEYLRIEKQETEVISNFDDHPTIKFNKKTIKELYNEYLSIITATYRHWKIDIKRPFEEYVKDIEEKLKTKPIVFGKDNDGEPFAVFGFFSNDIPIIFWYDRTGCQLITLKFLEVSDVELIESLKCLRKYLGISLYNRSK